MKTRIATFAAVAALMFGGIVSVAHAETVPCENALKDLRAAKAAAKLNDADAKTVADLEAKGVERCNADDDKRADEFFTKAMTLMGK